MPICVTCNTQFHGDEQFCPRDGTPLQEAEPGDRLLGRVLSGRYRLLELLGQGGMGAVYRAHHILMDKPVAVKVLRNELASNTEAVARFHREARSASRLDHDHIIRVTDFGQSDDGLLFLVMELLDGESLAEVVRRGPLLWRQAAAIMRDVALGLAHAHEQGIIHRDLKPENIVLARRGRSRQLVKVLDFGLAKLMHEAGETLDPAGPTKKSLTRTGVVFGTPEYMSPEQAEGQALDHHTDIYGLGVVCYQMVTGGVPFTGSTFISLITKTVQQAPEPPSQRLPGVEIPAELEGLILRCLEKKPADRPQSAEEVAAELDRVLLLYPDPEKRASTGELSPQRSGPPAPAPRIAEQEALAATQGSPVAPAIAASSASPVPAATAASEETPGDLLRPARSRTGWWVVGTLLLLLAGAALWLVPRLTARPASGLYQPPAPAPPEPVHPATRDPLAAARQLLEAHKVDEALALLVVERQRTNSAELQRLMSAAYEAKNNRLRALGHMQVAVFLSKGNKEEPVTGLAMAQLLSRLSHPQEACRALDETPASGLSPDQRRDAEALGRTLHCHHKP